MRAEEARELYRNSIKNIVREDVVEGMLSEIYKDIERLSKKCIGKTSYHFGNLFWPFAHYFPNRTEKEVLLKKLKEMGYYADYEVGYDTFCCSSDLNVINIEWEV